eukprot:scaffold1654_cov340-Prasinococcus_capsulatus_cf.AAC.13
MHKGSLASITATCGVTPHAQKSGTSRAASRRGASPKSGRSTSSTPSSAGSPTCTGAPCTPG